MARLSSAFDLPAQSTESTDSIDDGWCLDPEPPAAPASPVLAEGSSPTLSLVPPEPEPEPLPPPPPAPAPSIDMLLTAAEAAFFADGEALHQAAPPSNDFSDLAPEPKPGFWQRLLRR